MKVKGWKNINKDLKCRDFQFKIGKTYKHKGDIELCNQGFHFHENSLDIYKYYKRNDENLVVEVEASGEIITGDDKSVCSEIKIIRILEDNEVKSICNLVNNTGLYNSGNWNSGSSNSGYSNSGNWNSGYSNSGSRNSGSRNSGSSNSGDSNSGSRNSGSSNSGDSNSGNWNSGYSNSGSMNSGSRNSGSSNSGDSNSGSRNSGSSNSGSSNSGNWNSGSSNSGNFNTKTPDTILVFNKNCKKEIWDNAKKPNFLYFSITEWINEAKMTEQEKIDNPKFFCQKGYLKTLDYKEAFQKSFDNRKEGELELLEALPNFNWKVFTEISGIKKPKKK